MVVTSFLFWLNWLSDFRMKLPPPLREENVLLIMDGHNSRENPLALALLRRARVKVYILPSHTTHVLQMFDVGLASPLKKEFTSKFRKELKKLNTTPSTMSNTAKLRYAAIKAFISAWDTVCTPINCESTAKTTGTYPVSAEAAKMSPFVRKLTDAEREKFEARKRRNENRVSISGRIITEAEFIVELANYLKVTPKNAKLCNLQETIGAFYSEIVHRFLQDESVDARLLSTLPPFFSPNRPPVFFT